MQLKIYQYFGSQPREIAIGLVDLTFPPRVTEGRTVGGSMPDALDVMMQ